MPSQQAGNNLKSLQFTQNPCPPPGPDENTDPKMGTIQYYRPGNLPVCLLCRNLPDDAQFLHTRLIAVLFVPDMYPSTPDPLIVSTLVGKMGEIGLFQIIPDI